MKPTQILLLDFIKIARQNIVESRDEHGALRVGVEARDTVLANTGTVVDYYSYMFDLS